MTHELQLLLSEQLRELFLETMIMLKRNFTCSMKNVSAIHSFHGILFQIVRRGSDWSLVGAVDVGPLCNNINILIKKKKSVQMATHVLQFVFHGVYGFRWPVTYFGTNPGLSHQIYFNFWKIVEALGDHDFIIDYVMLDGASTNRAFQTMLLGTKPSLLRQDLFQTTDIFYHHQISV